MNNELAHLTTGVAALLTETDERRIRATIASLGALPARQAGPRSSELSPRPPAIAIYGDSGMGKTTIMKRFREEHPPRFNR